MAEKTIDNKVGFVYQGQRIDENGNVTPEYSKVLEQGVLNDITKLSHGENPNHGLAKHLTPGQNNHTKYNGS